ncbi:MAG TPA: hypothetical protein VFN67_39175 [Polyangiales bacterium]|jgi:hypothetical protein|nr:hypothetical protein [Polyangiales bacterium]
MAAHRPPQRDSRSAVSRKARSFLQCALLCSVAPAALALLGCGARPPLPTLSLHAVLVLRQAAMDAQQTSSHDFGLQAQLAFRPRGAPRTRGARVSRDALPIALPETPDCQHALACEWAQLAEESTLSALGVSP